MKNNIDWESVGKRIVSLRAINNMSREDLASKIGSSVSTVFRIESGLPPTSQYLILIASACELPPAKAGGFLLNIHYFV